jgi:hypothetical protein
MSRRLNLAYLSKYFFLEVPTINRIRRRFLTSETAAFRMEFESALWRTKN